MKSFKACAWIALSLAITGEASADWLGRYIPPGSNVSDQEIADGKIKNTVADLDAEKITVSDVTLGCGAVVRDPIFNMGGGESEPTLTGTHIRYNYTYINGSPSSYSGDLPQAATSAFSFGIHKATANDPKVKVDRFSFTVSQYAIQADNAPTPWQTRALGSVQVASLQFSLYITLDNDTANPIVLTAFDSKARYMTDSYEGVEVSFDLAAALKDKQYTDAKFDLKMEPVGNGSTADVNGSIFLSDIVLEGTTPEPTSLLLALMGAVPMMLRRRR